MKVVKLAGFSCITDIPDKELSLDKTLNCGQAFRWNKLNNGSWEGVINGKIVMLTQGVIEETNKNGIITNLNEEDTKNILIPYLDLDTNYQEKLSKIQMNDFEKQCCECGLGIHILRQDLLEIMVTFLMSQFNSMRNIRLIIKHICENYGNKLTVNWVGQEITDYSFPNIEKLSTLTYRDCYDVCRMGLRSQYFVEMIQTLKEHPEILDKLKNASYNEAMKILTNFDGIGVKVANCICLFALHHTEAFPIDVHIKRIIDEHFDGNLDFKKYGDMAGVMQQYMYYYQAFKMR